VELSDALYNSLLYTPGKNAKTAGGGFVYLNGSHLYATDGYVILRTDLGVVTGDGFWAVEDVKGYLKGEPLPGTTTDGPITWWADVTTLMDQTIEPLLKYGAVAVDGWPKDGAVALSPQRLSKLSRLRPQGEYPIDFTYSDGLLVFRYGPDTFGIMSPLARPDQPLGSLW